MLDREEMQLRAVEMWKDIMPSLTDAQLWNMLCHPEEFHDYVLQFSTD